MVVWFICFELFEKEASTTIKSTRLAEFREILNQMQTILRSVLEKKLDEELKKLTNSS